MDKLEGLLFVLDQALNTKRKKHIVGGILMSVSLLFGGLAVTIMTLKMEDYDNERYIE